LCRLLGDLRSTTVDGILDIVSSGKLWKTETFN
jgi:hypothetical protein